MPKNTKKAYKIVTNINEPGEWMVYSAETDGKAKTMCVNAMRDVYKKANYSWIKSCLRIPEYDSMAEKGKGCIAWKLLSSDLRTYERWELDRSNWFEE
jgi:hypothetical protein